MHPISPLFDVVAEHGESPVWDPAGQTLYWVDLLQGAYFSANVGSGPITRHAVGQPLGVLALREQGGLVMALRDGFALYNDTTKELTWLHGRLAAQLDGHHPEARFNDGAVDPAGRFLAGTMLFDGREAVGQLYSLGEDRQLDLLEQALFVTNGMDWSPDGKTFFLTDTGHHVIYAYDYDVLSGTMANRREFIRFQDDEFPDGMTVDAAGGFWVAMWGGGCIRRFDASANPLETIELPVTHPTSCCFGGNELKELFITTSRLELTEADRQAQPLAGRLLHLSTDTTGQVQRRYRG